ncbi:MAG: GNAT family N-acetyltransferase [Aggregatilineales bacterium]
MKVPQQLETDRLILRRLIKDDIQPFYKFMSDPESTRHMAFTDEQKTLEGAKEMVEWTITSYATDDAVFVLAITLKDGGDYIGSLGASPDPDADATEIFYTLLPDYRGKGYAVEAAKRLVNYLQNEEQTSRITAYVMTGNAPSIRVAERLGMTFDADVVREGHEGSRYLLTMWKNGS